MTSNKYKHLSPEINKWTDVKLEVIPIKVKALRPTQNEIGLQNSLKYALKQEEASQYLSEGAKMIVSPIVTYRSTYVLDGHHRWSQLYMMNPEASIIAYNIEEINENGKVDEAEDVLRRLQVTIGSFFGGIPSSTGENTINVYADLLDVENYLTKEIKGPNPTVRTCLLESIKAFLGWEEIGEQNLREKTFQYLLNNIKYFKDCTKPSETAPNRDLMPQTDGGDDFKNVKIVNPIGSEEKEKPKLVSVISQLVNKSSKLN